MNNKKHIINQFKNIVIKLLMIGKKSQFMKMISQYSIQNS